MLLLIACTECILKQTQYIAIIQQRMLSQLTENYRNPTQAIIRLFQTFQNPSDEQIFIYLMHSYFIPTCELLSSLI